MAVHASIAFGTDRGPACDCGSTLYGYGTADTGRLLVQCMGCHKLGFLRARRIPLDAVHEISEMHLEQSQLLRDCAVGPQEPALTRLRQRIEQQICGPVDSLGRILFRELDDSGVFHERNRLPFEFQIARPMHGAPG